VKGELRVRGGIPAAQVDLEPVLLERAGAASELRTGGRRDTKDIAAAAKRFSESMPLDAARVTLTGMAETIARCTSVASRGDDRLRLDTLMGKIDGSLSTLGSAIIVAARAPSAEDKQTLQEIGAAMERLARALVAQDPVAEDLAAGLRELELLAPSVEAGALSILAERFESSGREDLAAVLYGRMALCTDDLAYVIRSVELEITAHLREGHTARTGDLILGLEDMRSRLSDPDGSLARKIHDLSERIERTKSAGRFTRGRTLEWYVAEGRRRMGPALCGELDRIRSIDREHEAVMREFGEVWDKIRALEGRSDAPAQEEQRSLNARKNALSVKASLLYDKLDLGAAEAEMAALDRSLRSTSGISAHDAQVLASALIYDESLGANEASVREWAADAIQLTGGRGLAAVTGFQSSHVRLANADGEGDLVDLGPEPKREHVLHELGHKLEESEADLAPAAIEHVVPPGHPQPRAMSELYPDLYTREEDGERVPVEDSGVGYPGDFIVPYVGRVYSHEEGLTDSMTTEAYSIGLQYFASPRQMLALARKDPTHFALMVGALVSGT
jgi:hypothetical protein